MNKKFAFPILLFLFWIALFNTFRIGFFYANQIDTTLFSWLNNSILLDISVASYLTLPALIFWMFSFIFKKTPRFYFKSLFIFNLLLFILVCVVELASIELYEEWGTTFNNRAFQYLTNDKEAWPTIFNQLSFTLIIAGLSLFVYGNLLLKRLHQLTDNNFQKKYIVIPIGLVYLATFIIGVRGGISNIPIQVSDSFYSNNQSINYLSVNKLFYFGNSLKQRKRLSIEDKQYSTQELTEFFNRVYPKNLSNQKADLITALQPNIVLIILEGCPADVFAPLKGTDSITLNFSKLSEEGLLFTNFYASGTRTDQGLLSILSGIPSLPYLNIMSNVEQIKIFPCIIQNFRKEGYNTSFFYGGDLNFSNFNNYFLYNNTEQIIGKDDFPKNQQIIEWGVPDDLLFKKVKNELHEKTGPFFTCILTQSSHRPFDLAGAYKFGDNTIADKYKSSVFFTDSCIGRFIEESKNENWYDQTLFIITSDHGSRYLNNIDFNDHRRFQIPLLLVGPALNQKYKGKEIHQIGNSNDIPSTILSMININDGSFVLSKNLLGDQLYSRAYWATEHTLGWITDQEKIVINHETAEVYFKTGNNNVLIPKKDALMYYKLSSQYILGDEKLNLIKK